MLRIKSLGMRQPKVEILKVEKEQTKHNWKAISDNSAKAKYKFNIYSRKEGNIAVYGIAKEMPKDYFWTQLAAIPKQRPRVSFEEEKTPKWDVLRILKDGVPERHKYAQMRIPRVVGAL